MSVIAFIGLGNMGLPMARNLLQAGHDLCVFDLAEAQVQSLVSQGARAAKSIAAAVEGAEIAVTMLPAGAHVKSVYLAPDGVIARASKGALLIDSSTIDIETARAVADAAARAGFDMCDAPVSGGVMAAANAALTFMVGGSDAAFRRAHPCLSQMGKAVIHAGPAGNGQAAKICNNMMLGIQMISVCEGFALAERLGLAADKLFEISSKASGQCWSLTSYCPVPGPVPASPANRNYQPGFSADMMLKDLRLAQQAAAASGVATPLGAEAAALYALFSNAGNGGRDFSGIIALLKGEAVSKSAAA